MHFLGTLLNSSVRTDTDVYAEYDVLFPADDIDTIFDNAHEYKLDPSTTDTEVYASGTGAAELVYFDSLSISKTASGYTITASGRHIVRFSSEQQNWTAIPSYLIGKYCVTRNNQGGSETITSDPYTITVNYSGQTYTDFVNIRISKLSSRSVYTCTASGSLYSKSYAVYISGTTLLSCLQIGLWLDFHKEYEKIVANMPPTSDQYKILRVGSINDAALIKYIEWDGSDGKSLALNFEAVPKILLITSFLSAKNGTALQLFSSNMTFGTWLIPIIPGAISNVNGVAQWYIAQRGTTVHVFPYNSSTSTRADNPINTPGVHYYCAYLF